MSPETEAVIAIIKYAIGPGSGFVVKGAVDQIIEWRTEDGKPPSPKTSRRLAILVSAVLPSLLYGLLALLTWQYDLGVHIMAILAAFGVSQWWHGEKELPTGADLRVAALLGNAGPEPPKE